MKTKLFNTQFIFVVSLIILAVISRLLPHFPNFTPVAAIALFGGALIPRKSLAYLIPIVVLLISDIIIGLHITMVAVYLCLIFTVTLGTWVRKNMNAVNVFATTLISSLVFYLVTNFAVWVTGMVGYPMNFGGLIESYVAAIPFFRMELLGNLFYVTVLFGSYALVKSRTRLFA
ncbi:MAG: DUF6580 family putative transport protein [Bacteroidota bacterium]